MSSRSCSYLWQAYTFVTVAAKQAQNRGFRKGNQEAKTTRRSRALIRLRCFEKCRKC